MLNRYGESTVNAAAASVLALVQAQPACGDAPASCVIVAGRTGARVFSTRMAQGAETMLVEEADLALAETLASVRELVQTIAAHVRRVGRTAPVRKIVLVAPPGVLGFLREPLQRALGADCAVMALARDYTDLSAEQLSAVLDLT